MSTPQQDSFKYRLLKLVDISGFRVLDPPIRLLFGEEPRKQLGEIVRFIIVPTCFVFGCVVIWSVIAPRHKTKSGEVPTPTEVLAALDTNNTLSSREDEKQTDFLLQGQERKREITRVTKLLEQKKQQLAVLREQLADTETECATQMEQELSPWRQKLSEVRADHQRVLASDDRKARELAASIATGAAERTELLSLIRKREARAEEAKEIEKRLKDRISDLESSPPRHLRDARIAVGAAANEVTHLNQRLTQLQSANRDMKLSRAGQQTAAAMKRLNSAQEADDILAAAELVVRSEDRVTTISEQSYAPGSTIWFQVQRSLFTVFVGFLLAAVVAIPVGIMCGLNRVVMACLTPIISVFKPVSPVVWLLIFQIVIGAFFPDPENHGLFLFFDSLPVISELGVNPALVFSACTVAMCALWPALVNTALGVSSIDEDHLNVARVLRLGLWSRLTKIIIPSSLPLVFAGLRISLGVGWMVLIAAEALSSSDGLGKFVWDEYQNGSSHSFANIIFACFVVGVIGFVLDRIMIVLQRSVSFDEGAAVV